ncbi:MAG: transposase [Opitutaceae bacterium]|nr:transposase [Opitutaceae bacterium]
MPAFQPFDPRGPLTQSWRNLPHWDQPGATYFLTFRLADSLPAAARARLAEMRDLNDAESFAWIERHLDAGAGSCVFAQPENAAMMAAALRHFDGTRYELGAYAVMPNHVHALVRPLGGETRAKVVHAWKSYSARELQRAGVQHGHVWQEEGFDRIVRDESELRRFHDYILANPTVARLPAGTFVIGTGKAKWLP